VVELWLRRTIKLWDEKRKGDFGAGAGDTVMGVRTMWSRMDWLYEFHGYAEHVSQNSHGAECRTVYHEAELGKGG